MSDMVARLAILQSGLFHDWPDGTLARLIEHADVMVAQAGTCVFCPGDIAKYLYIVAAGSMTVSRETASGRKFVAALHLPGEFHGLPLAISQGPHIFTAVCREKSMLVRIPGDTLRSSIAANGQLSFSLFAALERRYYQALQLHASASVDSTRTRIARLLKSFDERRARVHAASGIDLSQVEIAEMLGTRRQVVNRAVKEMAAEGAIHVQYGRISIIDREKLAKMASA